ncbi:MAG: MBL fold metallo-hydrolase [Gemmatimonadota bacterium]
MRADRVFVVGSGTVIPEAERGGTCLYARMADRRILIDAGPGAARSLERLGLPWAEITDLILTHFHADHVGGLPGLFFALRHGVQPPRTGEGLEVWGPPGTRRLFESLAAALGDFFVRPGFPLRITEVKFGGGGALGARVRLATCKTAHTDESQAIRLDSPTGSLGFTGDTGAGAIPELGPFFHEVSVLVAECSLPDDRVGDNHLSPGSVARLGAAAEPAVLALTHVYPETRALGDLSALVRTAGFDGTVSVVHDGWSWDLGRASADPTPGRNPAAG